MRQIKFRAWDPDHSEWIQAFDVDRDGLVWYNHVGLLNAILEQFTGLKDANGKEIYEGDVVRWTLPKGFCHPTSYEIIQNACTTISQVVWVDGCYELHGIGEYRGWETLLHGDVPRNEYATIIGNIHQNPELMEKHNQRAKPLLEKEK